LREKKAPLHTSITSKARRQRRPIVHRILAMVTGGLPTAESHKLTGRSPKRNLACTLEVPPPPLSPAQPATPASKALGRRGEEGDLLATVAGGERKLEASAPPLLGAVCHRADECKAACRAGWLSFDRIAAFASPAGGGPACT
jgi:hypothetical protein